MKFSEAYQKNSSDNLKLTVENTLAEDWQE